jgi:hypothetical protein
LHVDISQRGDFVTFSWTENEIDEGKRESSLSSKSVPKDQYRWFVGNKKWLLVDFESTLSTDWNHMQLVEVVFEDKEEEEGQEQEQEQAEQKKEEYKYTTGQSSDRRRSSTSSTGLLGNSPGRKKTSKLPTPRLKLTNHGRSFQSKLNENVTQQVVDSRIQQNELDEDSSAARSSMSNPRLSFLGSHLYTSLNYDPKAVKHSRVSSLSGGGCLGQEAEEEEEECFCTSKIHKGVSA